MNFDQQPDQAVKNKLITNLLYSKARVYYHDYIDSNVTAKNNKHMLELALDLVKLTWIQKLYKCL